MSGSSLRSFEYLESLPGTVFNRLYQQPSTALAIFRRMLTHLAKTFVMAMLYIGHPLSVADLESWVRPDSRRERDQAINLLERLHILRVTADPGKPRAYTITNPFLGSLRLALTGGGNHNSFGVPCNTPDKNPITVAELDEYARRQWEGVLGYMVGSAGASLVDEGVRLSDGVKKLLKDGGLVKQRFSKAEITQEGFAFILQEVNAQVWTVLIYYLDAAEEMNMDSVDVLSFLFMLGSLELGQDYSKATLTPTQLQMLDDLSDFGIVYQHATTSSRFYPTRLATTLTSDSGALRSASAGFDNALRSPDGKGFIVIETNYRVYAYTTSQLQIAILQLFTRLSTRYPNMVAGKITRESIRHAVAMGITSEQIISFLTTHAHPQMRKNNPILPATVVDQIRLWQIEGERMKATPGFLFKDFLTAADYEACSKYAEEIGVSVWKNENRRMFFVTRYEQVAAYLKNRPKRIVGS
ncbi:RNA polymerase II transcription factor B 52 kDa subunit [Xylographa pallens]|nr:RNA polymerase II transcription factor B 52 kDa subunit [Xylographa pallens]